jgi:hypothetical protein
MDNTDATTAIDTAFIEHPGIGESGPTRTLPACPLDRIRPASWNPRKHFDEAALADVARTLRALAGAFDQAARAAATL